jgi:hypothetical protein
MTANDYSEIKSQNHPRYRSVNAIKLRKYPFAGAHLPTFAGALSPDACLVIFLSFLFILLV